MVSQITGITIIYSTVHSGADQKKHQSSASLTFVWGIHRWPVNSPHKWPVTRKMFPFNDVIMSEYWVRTPWIGIAIIPKPPCSISEWCDNFISQYRGFETSQDFDKTSYCLVHGIRVVPSPVFQEIIATYPKISRNLGAVRNGFRFALSLWNLTGASVALLPRRLWNFRTIRCT